MIQNKINPSAMVMAVAAFVVLGSLFSLHTSTATTAPARSIAPITSPHVDVPHTGKPSGKPAHKDSNSRAASPVGTGNAAPVASADTTQAPLPGGLTTGMQPDGTCIRCGPGDNACVAPGDCGYGDNANCRQQVMNPEMCGVPNGDQFVAAKGSVVPPVFESVELTDTTNSTGYIRFTFYTLSEIDQIQVTPSLPQEGTGKIVVSVNAAIVGARTVLIRVFTLNASHGVVAAVNRQVTLELLGVKVG